MTERVLFCGSRNYRDADTIRRVMAEIPQATVILHGDCPTGADALAEQAAILLGSDTLKFPADWKKHGRRAGPIRNAAMLDYEPRKVYAFGTGKGTDGTVKMAEARGIPVVRYA